MSEVKLPGSSSIKEILDTYKIKLESGVLPPDPARFIEYALRGLVGLEHLLPIPPILEYIHANFTRKLVEALPRLPMTSDFHEYEWLKWIKEEFKV